MVYTREIDHLGGNNQQSSQNIPTVPPPNYVCSEITVQNYPPTAPPPSMAHGVGITNNPDRFVKSVEFHQTTGPITGIHTLYPDSQGKLIIPENFVQITPRKRRKCCKITKFRVWLFLTIILEITLISIWILSAEYWNSYNCVIINNFIKVETNCFKGKIEFCTTDRENQLCGKHNVGENCVLTFTEFQINLNSSFPKGKELNCHHNPARKWFVYNDAWKNRRSDEGIIMLIPMFFGPWVLAIIIIISYDLSTKNRYG